MLVFAIVAVFVAGLMVGRTPEYLGKKIEAFEMKMASLAILFPFAVVLIGTAVAVVIEPGTAGIGEPGRARLHRGPVRLLLGRQQQRQRLRRALGANTPFYNTALGIAMLISRYWLIVPVLAHRRQRWRARRTCRPAPGTLPTHTPLFIGFLVGTVLVVGALTFVPALALGPIVEHLQLWSK